MFINRNNFLKNASEFKKPNEFKNKKEFKKYVNQHGGFTRMKAKTFVNAGNDISSITVPAKFKDDVPEDAIYFEGIASDGSENMNGYKIDASAWVDSIPAYMDDFGGKVYYQHDMSKPIGQTLEASVSDQLQVKGFAYDDTHSNKEIRRNLTTDLSTGHLTLEVEYENRESGDRITEEEFITLLDDTRTWEEFLAVLERFVMVVTKLLWVEYSFVTVGANKASKITHMNAIFNRLGLEQDVDKNKLMFENSILQRQVNDVKRNGVEEEVSETTESSEAPAEPVEAEEKTEESTETATESEGTNVGSGADAEGDESGESSNTTTDEDGEKSSDDSVNDDESGDKEDSNTDAGTVDAGDTESVEDEEVDGNSAEVKTKDIEKNTVEDSETEETTENNDEESKEEDEATDTEKTSDDVEEKEEKEENSVDVDEVSTEEKKKEEAQDVDNVEEESTSDDTESKSEEETESDAQESDEVSSESADEETTETTTEEESAQHESESVDGGADEDADENTPEEKAIEENTSTVVDEKSVNSGVVTLDKAIEENTILTNKVAELEKEINALLETLEKADKFIDESITELNDLREKNTYHKLLMERAKNMTFPNIGQSNHVKKKLDPLTSQLTHAHDAILGQSKGGL